MAVKNEMRRKERKLAGKLVIETIKNIENCFVILKKKHIFIVIVIEILSLIYLNVHAISMSYKKRSILLNAILSYIL